MRLDTFSEHLAKRAGSNEAIPWLTSLLLAPIAIKAGQYAGENVGAFTEVSKDKDIEIIQSEDIKNDLQRAIREIELAKKKKLLKRMKEGHGKTLRF